MNYIPRWNNYLFW